MSKGWEVAIGIQENFLGYGSLVGITDRPHWFLYVDNETLGRNIVVRERDAKLIPARLSPIESASEEQTNPGGEIQWQPRANDSLGIFMSFFQTATLIGGDAATAGYGGSMGTWVFTPINRSLTWSGSNAFATSQVFPINVVEYFGEPALGTGDAIRFERGVCSRLTLEQDRDADLVARAELRFLSVTDEVVAGTGFKTQPNAIGSLSQDTQFVDWNATLTVGGSGTHPIEKIMFDFDNGVTERRKLGQRGFFQFPFNRAIISGEFELETEDMAYFKEGTAGGTVVCRWDNGNQWIEAFCPNVFYRAHDPNVGDAGPVIETISFRAYPTAFGGSNAGQLSVYPKYGTEALADQNKLYFG
jgi:hypothetical protein